MKLLSLFVLKFSLNKLFYKATIYSSYMEYRQCFYNVKKTDSTFQGGLLTIEEYDKLSPETREALIENTKKQKEIVKEMVSLVKVYCKKYPEEDVCKFCNFKTYDEYPYRLDQTVPEWMKRL